MDGLLPNDGDSISVEIEEKSKRPMLKMSYFLDTILKELIKGNTSVIMLEEVEKLEFPGKKMNRKQIRKKIAEGSAFVRDHFKIDGNVFTVSSESIESYKETNGNISMFLQRDLEVGRANPEEMISDKNEGIQQSRLGVGTIVDAGENVNEDKANNQNEVLPISHSPSPSPRKRKLTFSSDDCDVSAPKKLNTLTTFASFPYESNCCKPSVMKNLTLKGTYDTSPIEDHAFSFCWYFAKDFIKLFSNWKAMFRLATVGESDNYTKPIEDNLKLWMNRAAFVLMEQFSVITTAENLKNTCDLIMKDEIGEPQEIEKDLIENLKNMFPSINNNNNDEPVFLDDYLREYPARQERMKEYENRLEGLRLSRKRKDKKCKKSTIHGKEAIVSTALHETEAVGHETDPLYVHPDLTDLAISDRETRPTNKKLNFVNIIGSDDDDDDLTPPIRTDDEDDEDYSDPEEAEEDEDEEEEEEIDVEEDEGDDYESDDDDDDAKRDKDFFDISTQKPSSWNEIMVYLSLSLTDLLWIFFDCISKDLPFPDQMDQLSCDATMTKVVEIFDRYLINRGRPFESCIRNFKKELEELKNLWITLRDSKYLKAEIINGSLKPRRSQLYVVLTGLKYRRVCNLSTPGFGKTLSSILTLIALALERGALQVIIFSPNNSVRQWGRYLVNTISEEFSSIKIVDKKKCFIASDDKIKVNWCDYLAARVDHVIPLVSNKRSHENLKYLLKSDEKELNVFCLSYECLKVISKQGDNELMRVIKCFDASAVFIDEFHRIKSEKSAISVVMQKFLKNCANSRPADDSLFISALSATPLMNRLRELKIVLDHLSITVGASDHQPYAFTSSFKWPSAVYDSSLRKNTNLLSLIAVHRALRTFPSVRFISNASCDFEMKSDIEMTDKEYRQKGIPMMEMVKTFQKIKIKVELSNIDGKKFKEEVESDINKRDPKYLNDPCLTNGQIRRRKHETLLKIHTKCRCGPITDVIVDLWKKEKESAFPILVYTERIEDHVEYLVRAITAAGVEAGHKFTYAAITGQNRTKFGSVDIEKLLIVEFSSNKLSSSEKIEELKRRFNVVIVSSTIAEAVDGLDKIYPTMILNTMPWTSARFEQLTCRIVRRNQSQNIVRVFVIQAIHEENGDVTRSATKKELTGDERIWDIVMNKKSTMIDCVLDGRIRPIIYNIEKLQDEMFKYLFPPPNADIEKEKKEQVKSLLATMNPVERKRFLQQLQEMDN